MIVRIILILGIGLILLSGGAMGWQYWQTHRGEVAADEAVVVVVAEAPAGDGGTAPVKVEVPAQNWLISPGGGLVDRDTVRNVLRQDKFVEGRVVTVRFVAPVASLLGQGEALPEPIFLPVFADIRAKALAGGFCPVLISAWATGCAVDKARLAEDQLGEAGEAVFSVTLAVTEKVPAPLIDLSSHALFSGYGRADLGLDAPASAEAALAAGAAAAEADCAAQSPDSAQCRVTRLSVDWAGPGQAEASWQIAWFAPLPAGMYPAPPLY